MPTKTFVESHLKAWDKEYARRGRLWGGGVKDLPPLTEGSAVLELGCGDGKTLASMPSDWKIVALDVSREALRLAHRVRGDVALILADASCLPLQSEGFEAVFAFHVTGHLLEKDRCALASEAARALVPGGRLFFRDFCEQDMRAGQGEEVEARSFLRGGGILTPLLQGTRGQRAFLRATASVHRHALLEAARKRRDPSACRGGGGLSQELMSGNGTGRA